MAFRHAVPVKRETILLRPRALPGAGAVTTQAGDCPKERLLDCNVAGRFQLLCVGSRNRQAQNTVLVFGVDILGLDITHIEAAAACTAVAFLTDIAALLVLLILIQPLCGADRQISLIHEQQGRALVCAIIETV